MLFKYVVSIDKHDDIFLGMWSRMTFQKAIEGFKSLSVIHVIRIEGR